MALTIFGTSLRRKSRTPMIDDKMRRQARRRWVWRVVPLLVLALGQLTAGIFLATRMAREGSTVNGGLIVGTILLSAIALFFLLYYALTFPARRRFSTLQRMFPEATVWMIEPTSTLGEALTPFATARPVRLHINATVVADDKGMGFWRGGKTPVLVALVLWEEIRGMSVSDVDVRGTFIPAIVVELSTHISRFAPLSFLPCRPRFGDSFLIKDREQTEQVMGKMAAHRPGYR